MTPIAAKKTTKQNKVTAAKRAFVLGLLDTSWRLATAFLLPVIVGFMLDKNGSKTFTTIGMCIGVIVALLLIVQQARNTGDPK